WATLSSKTCKGPERPAGAPCWCRERATSSRTRTSSWGTSATCLPPSDASKGDSLVPAEIYIAGRPVGPGHPLFVMAEIGLNHNGDPALALALVDAAHRAGASAVKLQMFHADRLVAAAAPSPAHVKSDSLRELFALYELDLEACAAIVERARSHRLAVVVTAFDETMVDDLAAMGVDAFKIASGDVTHLALIEAAARTGRPLIISTGMSDADEVLRAVDCARGAGATAIAALHCVSAYPVPGAQQNLRGVAT